LRLGDVQPGEKRLFIAEGKGGHQRIVPVSPRFFATLAAYLDTERSAAPSTDRVFVVLKGPRRGQPLSAAGLDEIVAGARRRAGIAHLTCHQLRHTCFTRLREAGMALEAIQAQAGHRSIESTRIYLHLANDWLAGEYRRAVEAIDAQAAQGAVMPAPLVLEDDDAIVVERYLTAMHAADRRTGASTTQAARTCQSRIRRAGGWHQLTRTAQVDAVRKARSFTSWLMVTGQIGVDAEQLCDTRLRLGNAGRLFCPHDHRWFTEVCARLGTSAANTTLQWNTLVKIAVITGATARTVTDDEFGTARAALIAAYSRRRTPSAGRTIAAVCHRLQLSLFHAGQITTLRGPAYREPVSVIGWATVTPGFTETARRYVEQVR
jgi:hypothetical protein